MLKAVLKPAGLAAALAILLASPTMAKPVQPGTKVVATSVGFQALWQKLEAAVRANRMGIVSRASASRGAAARGVHIPGNAVIGVFRNDFAVRMLQADTEAGIEAPLRFYLTENPDGTASLTYRLPSAVFAPYGNRDLDAMAEELDAIWRRIVDGTVAN